MLVTLVWLLCGTYALLKRLLLMSRFVALFVHLFVMGMCGAYAELMRFLGGV